MLIMNKMLLIVDPQWDFISGSLPVPNAEKAMEALSEYVAEHGKEYECIVITTDWHPYNHSSFEKEGGIWPVHCVQYSTGAAIFDALHMACHTSGTAVKVLQKGNLQECEEYSIMQNKESSKLLEQIILDQNIISIDICGLAGNICVLNTLKDLVTQYGSEMCNVLTEYSPSLDDGSELNYYINELRNRN